MQHSHEVERDRIPQRRRADLLQAAAAELVQAAVAAFGVGELGDRRALLQDRFRGVGSHSLAEGEPTRPCRELGERAGRHRAS